MEEEVDRGQLQDLKKINLCNGIFNCNCFSKQTNNIRFLHDNLNLMAQRVL